MPEFACESCEVLVLYKELLPWQRGLFTFSLSGKKSLWKRKYNYDCHPVFLILAVITGFYKQNINTHSLLLLKYGYILNGNGCTAVRETEETLRFLIRHLRCEIKKIQKEKTNRKEAKSKAWKKRLRLLRWQLRADSCSLRPPTDFCGCFLSVSHTLNMLFAPQRKINPTNRAEINE